MTDTAVLSVAGSAQGEVLTASAALTLGGLATDGYPPLSAPTTLTISGAPAGAGSVWAHLTLLTIGNSPDIFFSGNQPVFTNQPDPVQVDSTQPASVNWPGPNVVAPTNTETYDPITPPTRFIGNQPVGDEPPSQVNVGHGQPGSANWPEAPWYEEPPPENPG